MSVSGENEEIVEIDDEKVESVTDQEVLLNFENFVITSHDYCTLERGEFLNDSVIDFYLTWLLKDKVSEPQREEVHVFSSHFFSRLISKPLLNSKVQAFERDPNKSKAEKAYLRVKGWTKKHDIFNKKLLVIPICHKFHWFMILICNPDCVGLDKVEQKIKGEPFFVVLDSFGHRRTKEIEALRTYLEHEYLEKRKIACSFGTSLVRAHYPRLPQQMNSTDCGVYLLEYAERIIEKRYVFRWTPIPDLSNWFTDKEVFSKRPNIAELIQTLSKECHPDKFSLLTFPTISFAPIDVDEIEEEMHEYPSSTRRSRESSYDLRQNPAKRTEYGPSPVLLIEEGSEEALRMPECRVSIRRILNDLEPYYQEKYSAEVVPRRSSPPDVRGECPSTNRDSSDESSSYHQRLRQKYSSTPSSGPVSEESPNGICSSAKRPKRDSLPESYIDVDEEPLIRRVKKPKKFTLCVD